MLLGGGTAISRGINIKGHHARHCLLPHLCLLIAPALADLSHGSKDRAGQGRSQNCILYCKFHAAFGLQLLQLYHHLSGFRSLLPV